MPERMSERGQIYSKIIERIFQQRWRPRARTVEFHRTDIEAVAAELQVKLPKNLGDLLYSFRFRRALPASITNTASSGRKWVIEHADGTSLVVEGDKIVGETPTLAPGGHFSYNSYHITGQPGRVHGSFHGLDDQSRRVFVRIPAFDMEIPGG